MQNTSSSVQVSKLMKITVLLNLLLGVKDDRVKTGCIAQHLWDLGSTSLFMSVSLSVSICIPLSLLFLCLCLSLSLNFSVPSSVALGIILRIFSLRYITSPLVFQFSLFFETVAKIRINWQSSCLSLLDCWDNRCLSQYQA